MQKYSTLEWYGRAQISLDSALSRLSTYALPILIGLASLVAVALWPSEFSVVEPAAVKFRVLEETAGALTPQAALAALDTSVPRAQYNNHLSEAPFWFDFAVPGAVDGAPVVVEFPSRHALSVSCWNAEGMRPLGRSDRQVSEGHVSASKAGFVLSLGQVISSASVLCRSTFSGPARLTVALWPAIAYQASVEEFHRRSGLMDGGLLVLATFVLITALFNRQTIYLVFSGWLIVNLRMAALSAGWDTQWLGHEIPQTVLTILRPFTLAVYYTVTIVLFRSMFNHELARVGNQALWNFAQLTCLPLLLLSAAAPYGIFLPVMWALSGYCIAIGMYSLYRILRMTPSMVAVLYGVSFGITLFASLYEVISAALGFNSLIGSINSVTAALSSSLLASVAIAEQMRKEHNQWVEAKEEMEQTFEAMPIGLFKLDLNGRFLSANPALRKMLGLGTVQPGSGEWRHYFGEAGWSDLYRMLQARGDHELEVGGINLPGQRLGRFLVKATLARDRIEGSLQDVTEKAKAEEELRFMANNDVLTKVLNRRGIEDVFSTAIARCTREGPLTLAYLDLDRFKLINDLYGHTAGDDVLQQVCSRVDNVLAGARQMGRVGGDEFVIVLPDTPADVATTMCQAIVDSIAGAVFHVGDKAFYVRASIGLIEVQPGTPMKDAISAADRACREAKAGGGKNLVVYMAGARAFEQHQTELKLVEQLASPKACESLFVVMQPIMSLVAPLESLNFEVLLRMRDDSGALIPTEHLIHAAEQSGRMSMIDRWVLSTTLEWLDRNASSLSNTRFVCMNLSGASLNDEQFMAEVFRMLAASAHITPYLCIEITEGVALHDLDNTRRFIEKVRGLGAKVALDDFGAGYTSFSYLKELTGDLLKIDGSFIVNMNSHPANIAIVEAIVNLAGNLGMKVIAEWAEDMATVQTLVEIGVDYVQGFAVARPQTPEMLLTATSSASFIGDENLAKFVHMIGNPVASMDLPDSFDAKKSVKLH